MTDSISSTRPIRSSRRIARQRGEAGANPEGRDLVETGAPRPPAVHATPVEEITPRSRRLGFVDFAAQILGGGQKRGLRGGPETLERARATYLETEWSGPSDRRLRSGRITKTEV
jgi:hypothetical protein